MLKSIRILLIIIITYGVLPLTYLQAADDGFRITPSIGLDYSYKYKQSLFKPTVDIDLTYLFPNRWELGVGLGYMHDILYADSGTVATLQGQDKSFNEWKKDSYPIYAVVKYSFDVNETDDIVVALKYGWLYTNKGSSWVNDDGSLQGFEMQNRFMADLSIGYELNDTIFSLDFRAVSYTQHFYLNEDEVNQKQYNGYLGLSVQHRFDLF